MRRAISLMVIVGAFMSIPMAAYAHECIVANRSDAGAAGSSNAGVWELVTTDDVIGFVVGEDQAEAVIAEYGDAYREAVEEAGLPTSFSIFTHHTIGTTPQDHELTPAYDGTGKSSDLRGIDHLFSGGHVDTYVALLLAVLS